MASGKGKEWETQLGTALKAAGCFSYNSNDINPASDFTANWKGLGMLLEAKETHSDTLAFDRVTPKQVKLLNAVHKAGGFAAVAICRAYPNKRRAWICPWPDWLLLQETIGRKSIPLRDGQRPAQLVELPRITRTHGLGNAFDLQPGLRPHLVALARKIILEFPEVLQNVQTQTPWQGWRSILPVRAQNPAFSRAGALVAGRANGRLPARKQPLRSLRVPKQVDRPSHPAAVQRGWR